MLTRNELKAERFIPRGTVIEISPVLLFEQEEYEKHGAGVPTSFYILRLTSYLTGKYTVVDDYTFVWPGNRMALALGLGTAPITYLLGAQR